MQLLFESAWRLFEGDIYSKKYSTSMCATSCVYMCIAKILITFTPNNGGNVLAESFVLKLGGLPIHIVKPVLDCNRFTSLDSAVSRGRAHCAGPVN